MNSRKFAHPALAAALIAAAFTLPSDAFAGGLDGRNDVRGPIEPSATVHAGARHSEGRNATPRTGRSGAASVAVVVQACAYPSGRNFARSRPLVACPDIVASAELAI